MRKHSFYAVLAVLVGSLLAVAAPAGAVVAEQPAGCPPGYIEVEVPPSITVQGAPQPVTRQSQPL